MYAAASRYSEEWKNSTLAQKATPCHSIAIGLHRGAEWFYQY
jgi:hypothetical protein